MSMHRSVAPIAVYVNDEDHVVIRDEDEDADGNEHDAIAIPTHQMPQILEWLEEGAAGGQADRQGDRGASVTKRPPDSLVHTIEPQDCDPEYLAWSDCRVAILGAAARLAREGGRFGQRRAKAMEKLVDERLARVDMPPVEKPEGGVA